MAVSLSISITQNSQSIANNTSNVTVKVTASWTGGSYNTLEKPGWVKIDGTTYDFTSPFNTGRSTTGSVVICTKTVNVAHASNGSKTLSCSASYTTGVSSGTITASTSKTLTTIPRKSTLTIGNGTLGTAMTVTINNADSSFEHRVSYINPQTGGEGPISGGLLPITASSFTWTPSLALATFAPDSTSVTLKIRLGTYLSNGSLVGENWYSTTLAIPASIPKSGTRTPPPSPFTPPITWWCRVSSACGTRISPLR